MPTSQSNFTVVFKLHVVYNTQRTGIRATLGMSGEWLILVRRVVYKNENWLTNCLISGYIAEKVFVYVRYGSHFFTIKPKTVLFLLRCGSRLKKVIENGVYMTKKRHI
jgi:hypothetical protein